MGNHSDWRPENTIYMTLFGRFDEVVAELATTRIRSSFPGSYSKEPLPEISILAIPPRHRSAIRSSDHEIPFVQPPGSVLYVPDSMYRPREPVGATNIGVALGWKDLYESSPSWDRVVARLRQYSLASTLQAIGAVSCILNTFRSPDVAQGQSQIISWLFADPPDLGRRFQRWADRHEIDGLPQVPVLFNDLQLITAAKIAIVALDIDAEPPSTSLEPLGEALLMVSDLIESRR